MSRRTQVYVFLGLLAVLAVALLRNVVTAPEITNVLLADEKFAPLAVENPSLRLDKLERIRKLEYAGTGRDIFNAAPPPPPVKPQPVVTTQTSPPPPPDLPLQLPFKFYGYASDPQTGKRRAFFTNGEDIWIAAEGETILGRFRLLRIGNTTAELEETASSKRVTLQLEQAPQG